MKLTEEQKQYRRRFPGETGIVAMKMALTGKSLAELVECGWVSDEDADAFVHPCTDD